MSGCRYAFLILFFLGQYTFSQEPSASPEGKDYSHILSETTKQNFGETGSSTIYKNEISGSLLLHSFGFGANFRKGKHITAKLRSIYSIEAVGMKHPKEYKTFNPNKDNNKGFVFGKLNSLTVLRPSAGIQKIMYTKEGKKGVQVSYMALAGASIGLVKPVYLEISQGSRSPSTEKYDPEVHTLDRIRGRAELLKGIEETKIYPGLHSKIGFNFEYAPEEEIIRAIETGIAIDAYYKKIPMMAFVENRQFFITYYVSWHFGKKSY
jgi:hypothetical protein